MPKQIALFLLFSLGLSLAGFAQSSHVTGNVSDTAEKKNLANGSVLLLRPADSILLQHTRTDGRGHFVLRNLPVGKYLLVITYPNYADYVDELNVRDTGMMTLPIIGMVTKSKLLQEVVVSGNRNAIRLKGDTTEFNADSFRTQPNATVEDLLKKLPGIQVDKNGKITAQGEAVKKVLVDGEEFFGDDPTLVTQSLRADMVDKVQVYDKKSDQATFTGIDDGKREKTINLKIKDGKKNGYFGRLTGGQGTEGYHDYQGMANYFKNKLKLSAYGIISNTGKTGLNWNERDNFGQSDLASIDVDENTGSLSWAGGSRQDDLDNWSGRFEGQGFPSVKTGGIHYNDKWNDDQQSLNGNYKYMQLDVNGESRINSQFILPDTFYYNNQRQNFRNQITRHSFNGIYDYKFDSTSSLKLLADGGTDHKTTYSNFRSEALASDSSLVNRNDRTITTAGDNRVVNSNLLWRKKLAKKGRTLSLNIIENYTENTSDGYLNSELRLYQNGLVTKDSLTDQYKNYRTKTLMLDAKLTYTEPLSSASFLSANYGGTLNNSHSDRNSFNKAGNGKYGLLDSVYSNDYQYNQLSQRGGLTYILVKKKLRFTAGSNILFTQYKQDDLHADTSLKRNFVNWNPIANATYSFNSSRRINFYYVGYTTQPQVNQIQPIRTNEDQTNITVGNPDLKPSFSNRFSMYFNDYKILSNRGIWMSLSYFLTENAISSNTTVIAGKRTTQFVNVNGNHSFYANLGYSFKWKKPGINFDIYGNTNNSTNVSYVDNVLNKTRSNTYSLSNSIWYQKEKKFEFNLRYSASYTNSRSSINTGITTDYWTYSVQPNADIFLPAKFQIHADADINLRQKTAVFPTNNNVVLLNGWIGRKFLKNDALLLKVQGNDILNQNVGFNRTVNSNFIQQNTYNTIQRYFMFYIVWNFTKAGTPAPNLR